MDPTTRRYINGLMTPEPRESKQPAWVREKLADLRRELQRALDRVEELRTATDPDGSLHLLNIHVNPVGLGRELVYFRNHLGEDPLNALYVGVDPQRQIIVATSGSSYLHVRPVSGNSVELHTKDPRP